MSKLITKARAGVTLVELLVVVLIVTILSVSLLPLLKPFVVEAQYAAEAIPVIGNLRTKIALYQYDKGPLPSYNNEGPNKDQKMIETWVFSTDGTAAASAGAVTDVYAPAKRTWGSSGKASGATAFNTSAEHQYTFGNLIDVDNQELVGKRCKPVHFQYAVVTNGSTYCYILGCFGDDHGLPCGTGYAVCEICVKGQTQAGKEGSVYKQIGVWKRYKAATEGQMTFGEVTTAPSDPQTAKKTSEFCPIPARSALTAEKNGVLTIVDDLRSWGWEF